MKLRINAKLRAALIAAIASLSFTTLSTGTIAVATGAALLAGQQAQAEDPLADVTYNGTFNNGQTTLTSAYASLKYGDADTTLTSWMLEFTITQENTKNTQMLSMGRNPSWASGIERAGLGVFIWNDGKFSFGIDGGENHGDTLVMGSGSADALAAANTPVTIRLAYDNGTAYLYSNGVMISRNVSSLNANQVNLVSSDGGQTYANSANFFTNGGANKFSNVKVTDLTSITGQADKVVNYIAYSSFEAPANYSWVATGERANWTDQVWNKNADPTPVTFADNGNAAFGAGNAPTVDITTAATASAVTVSGQDYTFNLADGGSLTAGSLTVTSDSLSLTGAGTVAAGSISASGKTITINEGVVLTGAGSGTLAGEGTFALASGSKALGSISLGEAWNGYVRLSGVSMANENLKNTYTKNGSWVEMNGVTGGYLAGWNNGSEDANIMLTNPDGGVAWKWSDGSSSGETLITFSGTWKGAGTFFKDTNDKRQGYKYTGNISDWTGDFRAKATNSDAVTKLEFAGSANDVKIANIKNEGVSALNIVLSTGGSMSVASNISKTSTGAVNLTIDNSTAATLSGTVTADSLTINAGSSLTNTGTLTLNGTITFGANAIQNNDSGSITLGNDVIFNIAGLSEVDKTYTLFSGTGDKIDLSVYGYTAANIAGVTTAGKTWTFGEDGTISYTQATQKVWSGEYLGEWNTTDANWSGSTFENGDSVLFNGDAAALVAPGIAASLIEVAAGNQVVLYPADGGTLSSAEVIIGAGSQLATDLSVDGVTNFNVGTDSQWAIGEGVTQVLGAGTNNGIIYVNEDATARLTDASNSKDLLLGIEGEGNVEIAVNTNIEGGTNEASKVSSQATGKLIIDQGVALTLGRPEISGPFQQRYIDLSSFSAVDLNGGTLKVHMNNLQLNNLTTNTANSTIHVMDTAGSNQPALTLKGTTTLNKDLTLTSNWKHQIVIEKLAGAGTLTLNGANDSVVKIGTSGGDAGTVGKISVQSDVSKVTIDGTLNITGDLETKKGSTVIAGNVTVGNNLDLSSGGESTGTLLVKNGAALTVAGMWGTAATQLDVEEGGTVNLAGMKIVGGTDGGAVVGTESGNAKYAVDSSDWYIYNADITAMDDITVGNQVLACTIDTGAYDVSLTNSTNWLLGATVGAEGSLTMAGGNLDAVITSEGTVTFTGDLAVEGFEEHEGAEGRMDVNGAFTKGTDGNGYAAHGDSYITIVDGGDVVADNIAVTQGEEEAALTYYLNNSGNAMREGSGRVTDYSTYYLTSDSVAVSALDDKTTAIEVTGGTVNVDSEYTGDIMVSGEGTIIGEHATPSQVGIAAESAANFVDGIDDTTNGVHYVNATDAPVVVENTGKDTIHYSIAETDAKVTADNIISDSDVEVQVDNQVVVNTIATYGDGTLILSQVDTDTLANIYADMGGSVTLKNVTNATLENLAMNNNTVAVYAGDTTTTEGTVTVTDTLTAGQGTLLANLTLKGGSTLNVAGGGDDKALTLGSMLTIDLTEGGLVNLDQTTIDALAGLQDGQSLDLIVAANGTQLDYVGAKTGMDYAQLFAPAEGLTGNYTVYAQGDAFGVTKQGAVPEPTTGTLSLLALMALAARRRRK